MLSPCKFHTLFAWVVVTCNDNRVPLNSFPTLATRWHVQSFCFISGVFTPYCPGNGRFLHPRHCEIVWSCLGMGTSSPQARLIFCPYGCAQPWYETRCDDTGMVFPLAPLSAPSTNGNDNYNTAAGMGRWRLHWKPWIVIIPTLRSLTTPGVVVVMANWGGDSDDKVGITTTLVLVLLDSGTIGYHGGIQDICR